MSWSLSTKYATPLYSGIVSFSHHQVQLKQCIDCVHIVQLYKHSVAIELYRKV